MASRRWMNPSQPQTLVVAVFLLYIRAAFAALALLQIGSLAIPVVVLVYYGVMIAGGVFAGRGIAEEKKWGYGLALAVAAAPFALSFWAVHNPFAGDLINVIFDLALVALLLHNQSREYRRIWFK